MSRRPRRALPPVAPRPEPAPRSERVTQIVAAARRVVEGEGPDALTMRRLGEELGIKAPSLYKHLPSRDAVVALLVDDALFETGDVLHAAVSAGDAALSAAGARGAAWNAAAGPVAALLAAYRRLGREHPHVYRLATMGTLPRSGLTPGLEGWAGEPFYRATGDPYRAQALWAFAHGTLILEIDDRFLPGSDLDQTWQQGARAFAG